MSLSTEVDNIDYYYYLCEFHQMLSPAPYSICLCDAVERIAQTIRHLEERQENTRRSMDHGRYFATVLGSKTEKKAHDYVLNCRQFVIDSLKAELNALKLELKVHSLHSAECLISDIKSFMDNIEE